MFAETSRMVSKLLFALAAAAVAAVRADPPAKQCPDGGVRFDGHASFADNEKPLHLSKEAVLTIDVSEETPSGGEPKKSIYTHKVPLSDYNLESQITYGFCAKLDGLDSRKISLRAHILDQAEDDRVEYIGETVVTAGSDSYEADLTLSKVEAGGSSGEPSVADCQFGQMAEDVTGIAVKASVKLAAKKNLPKPSYLAVTLREIDPESGEPEVISIFSGDVSSIYEPGKPLPAFLCAKVPVADEPVTYTLAASLHIGWDGFANPDDDERTPKKGDYVSSKEVEVQILFFSLCFARITSLVRVRSSGAGLAA
ncbi:hypothetical protein Efla_000049 [Eimeria flavescens]